MERIKERIPVWAISSIINDDKSGLENEDIELIEDWFAITGYDYVCTPNEKKYFSIKPAFGKACDVYECLCVKL